jgi:uncharacterized protein YkwD
VGGAVAIAALFVGPQAARAGAGCPDEDLVPTAANAAQVEQAVLCAINRERRAAGVVALNRAPKLDLSARFHTVSMVRRHFLAHEAPGHPTLLARVRGFGYFAGARDGIYAENVGAGPSYHGTARAMVTAWMESAGHRANILYAPFRDVGISAVPAPPDPAFFAGFPSTVYTTDFGTRYVRRRCVIRRTTTVTSGSAAPRRRYCRAPASR